MLFPKHRRGQIPVSCIRQEDDDCLSLVFWAFGKLGGGIQGGAGGDADEDAFGFADKAAEGIMQILKTLRSDRMYVAILTEGNGFDQSLSKGLTAILDQFYQGIK